MLSIAIVEDEENYAELLEEFIHRYEKDSFHQFKIRHYRDGAEIADNYFTGFDIILMDIQMRFMDGMTAAEKIRSRDPEVLIIFITNRSDYAVRGYEVDALDYVVKPVEYFSFSQKLDRAVSRISRSRNNHIMIRAGGGLYKLSASQILFAESERHNVHFYTTTGELISRMNMSEAEELLRGFGFYRCGKGYLVNLDKIDSFSDGICRIGRHNVPVSRAKKKEFMSVLADHMGSRLV
jgi:DNA-binding LytR/AlgR family response regulator